MFLVTVKGGLNLFFFPLNVVADKVAQFNTGCQLCMSARLTSLVQQDKEDAIVMSVMFKSRKQT